MVTYTKLRSPSTHAQTWTQLFKLYLLLIVSTLVSSVSFSQVDFRQSANNDAGYTQGDVHWLNSILQQSNSTYVEGMSSLQRIILLNVESKSSHTITFSHQSIKSSAGAHAYDFITSWAQAKAVSNLIGSTSFNPAMTLFGNLNECGAEPGSDPTGYLSACQTAHSSNGGTNYFDAILDDNMADNTLGGNVKDRIAAYEALAKSINPALEQRSIRVWGNAPVTNATVTFDGYTGGDQDANYTLTWNSTATTIVIEFATHLAVGRDPFKTSTRDIGYGAGKGAGRIPGGPYHVNLFQLDGASLGSQDNQIKAADVLIPPTCTVSGPMIICAEDGQKTYTSMVTDGGSSPSYLWSFVPTPNTVNAEFYNNTNLTANATIQPVGGPIAGDYLPGTFSLSMTVTTQEGLSATCALASNVTIYKVTAGESHTPISCFGGTSTATITATGGTAPYTFTLNSVTNNTGVFPNLAAGTYTATVTDANGCGGSVAVNITQPPRLTCTIPENAPVLCNGQSNGTATVAAVGGTAPYTYLWDNGETTQTATQLNAGTHTVTVTDSKGCTTTCQVNITQPAAVSANATAGLVACNGGTATITVTGSGGTPPYTYSLDGITYSSTNTFTRGAGSYTAYVKDANGCIDDAPVTVNQPSSVDVSAASTPILCYGGNTTITLTGSGGTPPYTYSLDGVTYGSGNTFTRPAGNYTGYVKDSKGCIDNTPIMVAQPTAVVAAATATPILCYGGNTTITVTGSGGTPPYTYSLDGVTYGNSNTFTRASGSYTAYVKDANGCIDSEPITVNQPTAVVAGASSTPILCNGGNTTISLSASGGTPPYTYSLDGITYGSGNTFTRTAGSYTGYVKDANGCIDDVAITVAEPPALTCTTTLLKATDCAQNNGSATVTPTGGTAPYTYLWDNGETTATATHLSLGTHTATVTDHNGCVTTCTVDVPELPCPITFCSYTQGYYGNKNGNSCDGTTTYESPVALMTQLLQSGNMVVGNLSGKYITIPGGATYAAASAQKVNSVMPGGGTATTLPAGTACNILTGTCFNFSGTATAYLTKQGRINNVLLSQTITLSFNTRINSDLNNFPIQAGNIVTQERITCNNEDPNNLVSCEVNPYAKKAFPMNANVAAFLTHNGHETADVADLLALANDLLGGILMPGQTLIDVHGSITDTRYVPTYSEVNSAVDAINNAFDKCRTSLGYDAPLCPIIVTNRAVTSPETAVLNDLKISAYPNPYDHTVNFNFTSPVAGKALLEVYDVVGRRLAVVFEGQVDAGMQKAVNYTVPSAQRVPMIYRLSIGGKTSFGKLLPGNTD